MPIVELVQASKSYGGAPALVEVSFACEAGEIHAVLGENGAGKSTLMKLMAGVVQPTAGEVRVDGRPVRFASPRDARALGIVCMFQELSLVPDLTAAQNIVLSRSERLAGLSGPGPSPPPPRRSRGSAPGISRPTRRFATCRSPTSSSSRSPRRCMAQPRLLILDEATSALTKDQVERVFAVLRELRGRGVAILFISHRLYEVDAIADIVSIFRNGRHVATFPAGSRNRDEVVALMVGQKLTEFYPPRLPAAADGTDAGALAVRRLSWGSELAGVDFDLRPGEIVGVGGLDGQGQQHLLHALFGLLKGVTGEMTLDGRPLPMRPDLAKRAWPGLALFPRTARPKG